MTTQFIDKTEELLSKLKIAIKESLREIGITGVAEVQSNTPVDTGTLRRSYTFECEEFKVIIGTMVDYSIFVEFKPTSKGGRPHFRSSLERKESSFMKILAQKLGEINV